MKSFDEVDRLTIPEYNLLMEAERLKQIDMDYRNHLQAFLNFSVQAKRKAGKNREKPVYRTFKSFYDYEAAVKGLNKNENNDRFKGIGKIIKEKEGGR